MNAHLPTVATFALAGCMAMTGCQRQLSDTNLSCVKMDMSPKEVESILGPPNGIESKTMESQTDVKILHVVRYVYQQDGKTVTLHFVDGKLIGQDGSFEK